VADPGYVELHARSAFSFLRGASSPDALAAEAARLEIPAVAVCDRMGLYGSPRFRLAAQEQGVRDIVGAELVLEDGSVLPVLVENREGYRNLCGLLTRAHLRAEKGEGTVRWDELAAHAPGLVALTGGEEGPLVRALLDRKAGGAEAAARLGRLTASFGADRVFVELQRHHRPDQERWNRHLVDLARSERVPLLATNGVDYAEAGGRDVADVFTCLRGHVPLDGAGALLAVNAERHLKPAARMKALFADLPDALSNGVRLSERLGFRLTDLGYQFPRHPVGEGETMDGVLRDWALRGARERYRGAIPEKVAALLRKELALIGKLGFSGYFLIVADLVRWCRENDILAQGRGSAANSAVCFCLGVTAVDPVKFNVLFERFLSEGRKGWPDIDIDLPSGDRRERVIQEVYRRYAPRGAAMTGAVHTYRGRGTAREVGKVLGLPADVVERFSALFANGDFPHTLDLTAQMEKAGLPAGHPRSTAFTSLYGRVARLPRHLGQHSGGMIISDGGLDRFVPLENAAMPGRVVAQWDKDDCEELGIIKVDLLGLGMMSALQDAVTLCNARGRPVDLADLPQDDPATFDSLCAADTIGVFQVESRAQMATLPRMRPRCFYDLVVEVALIRPGPIQGDLAHPYLRRRTGEEPVTYYDERLVPVLRRTLGVPLFQEQMLEMAMVMADFSGDEAEGLRKALSFHRSEEKMDRAKAGLLAAMRAKGVRPEVAVRIAQAVGSFALYGFPESHAISFALLAYASAWLKVHRAPEFYAALLNNQPMGFYSAATLVTDAKRHGVQVRPVSVARSEWDCTIGDDGSIRLGFSQVQGLRREPTERLLEARRRRAFESMADFLARTTLSQDERRTLAAIGALNGLAEHRRAALWESERPVRTDELVLGGESGAAPLRKMDAVERIQADYAGMRLTTGPHPMALVRERIPEVWRAADLVLGHDGQRVRVAGQVICRQRPGTAKGVCFVSLEDETGITNVIVAPELFESLRLTITSEPFLVVEGLIQLRHRTLHIQARTIARLDHEGLRMAESHDFG
jgi:error-prone DNA polymerase